MKTRKSLNFCKKCGTTIKRSSSLCVLCSNKLRTGSKHTKESIKKMVDAHRGKKCSPETKEKMRVSHLGLLLGDRGSNWKGGITPEVKTIRNGIEIRLWREAVFARDNWLCQKYLERGGKLQSHHIKNFSQYPELRFAIDNGVTLSEKAHREFHRIYGRKNNTQEQLLEFLNKTI